MIGYYVHHVGSGHLHRATAIAAELDVPVVGLSSLPRPDAWKGDWVQLPRDDAGPPPVDATAGGRLHWVPVHDDGLRSRMAAVSTWIDRAGPGLLVADVSVEVALLARLHGVPVVSVVLPGRRDDEPHRLGFEVSAALLAAWPERARGMVTGLPPAALDRLRPVGAISRFPVTGPHARRPGPPRVVALLGRGGGAPSADLLDRARELSSGWEWTVLGGPGAVWCADPQPVLRDADVVVCQAGQNTLAEVAAARRPALVVPADRPHDEQRTTGGVLAAGGWPARVEDTFPRSGWTAHLEATRGLDGAGWADWCDGHGAARAAEVLTQLHGPARTTLVPA